MDRRRGRSREAQGERMVRRHRPDYYIVLFAGVLMLIGLVVMYAIGPQRAHAMNLTFGTDNYSDTYFFVKQFVSLLFAAIAFFLVAKLPFSLFRKHTTLLLMIGLGSCVVLALAGAIGLGIAPNINGAVRWFNFGALGSVQPAEFLKFALLLFVASFLGVRYKQGEINNIGATLAPLGILTLFVVFLVVSLQKDMGTGLALIAIVATMLFAAGLNARLGLSVVGVMVLAGLFLIVTAPHRMERVAAFFAGDSTSTEDSETYHIEHAKIAIGSGGIAGVGIGNSVQATGYLPEVVNDSVFAVMGETFGFVGLVGILGLFFALLYRVLRVADHLPNITMRLVVAGVFGWVGAHVMLNIAAMTGLIPLTGITLPLLSFGGTSMVFVAGALGLVFQLSQYTTSYTEVEGGGNEDSRSGRGLRRPRDAYRRRT
ncbi:MAG TPA: FtsW/RodA/SpoVE family cell cycle protein [Candidatus Saccharimonadales bacterium]